MLRILRLNSPNWGCSQKPFYSSLRYKCFHCFLRFISFNQSVFLIVHNIPIIFDIRVFVIIKAHRKRSIQIAVSNSCIALNKFSTRVRCVFALLAAKWWSCYLALLTKPIFQCCHTVVDRVNSRINEHQLTCYPPFNILLTFFLLETQTQRNLWIWLMQLT